MQATLRHYAWVIRHYCLLILVGVIFTSALTSIISVRIPSVYQANALVRVNSKNTITDTDVTSAQALAVSYALLVTDPEVLQAAAAQLPGMTSSQLKQAVNATPVDNTQVIEVRAQADTPQKAVTIANTVARVFIQVQVAKENTRLQHLVDQLAQNIANIKITVDTAQQNLTNLQNNHAALADIALQKSQLDTDQSNYTALLSSYQQIQVQKSQVSNILSIVQTATIPDKPVSPQIVLNTALAAGVSLLVMIVLALLLDWMDVTIKTTEDVVQLANLTPLGCIPASTSQTASAQLRDPFVTTDDPAREAFSLLGTSFLALNSGVRSLLVSSVRVGAGCSTTATYLALSLARAGVRVLLIDAHIRQPQLHEIFAKPNAKGLTNGLDDLRFLVGQPGFTAEMWLNQWKTQIPNLWLLPAGLLPLHPTPLPLPALRLLQGWIPGDQHATTAQLHSHPLDLIIYDTPPVEEGIDTRSLTAVADATVLVVEAGREGKEAVQHAHMLLQRLNAPIIGVVVNRQRRQHRSYLYVQPDATKVEEQRKVSPLYEHTLEKSLDIQRSLLPVGVQKSPSGSRDTVPLKAIHPSQGDTGIQPVVLPNTAQPGEPQPLYHQNAAVQSAVPLKAVQPVLGNTGTQPVIPAQQAVPQQQSEYDPSVLPETPLPMKLLRTVTPIPPPAHPTREAINSDEQSHTSHLSRASFDQAGMRTSGLQFGPLLRISNPGHYPAKDEQK